MSARVSIPAEPLAADAPDAWERALLDEQLAMLTRLAEMGMAVAGAIQARVTDPSATDAAVQHAAMDFARVSRAVRMTLALQSKLVRDFKTPVASCSAKAAFEDIEPGSLAALWLQPVSALEPEEEIRLRDAVRQAAEESGLEPEAVERLTAEAAERLERDDIHDLMARPFDQIVAFVREELGLKSAPHPRPPSDAAADGGGGPLAERSGERVVVGANHLHPPSSRFPERPHTWSG